MKILALDMGTKRMGVAVSDPLGITAQGLPNIDRADMAKDMERIKNIIETNQIGEIVVGLPLNMDGSEGPKAKEAIAFGDALKG
ncbi:MAG: Holliday junction resolvase RuvX, partial [Candidatus Omnitrophica bacterium]|nr:Holliday junction resolvase RuvX [Candidatus Omnitrophota bacterium]